MTKRSFAPRLRHLSIRAYFDSRHSCFVIPVHLGCLSNFASEERVVLFLFAHCRHVSPVSGVVVHAGEIAGVRAMRPHEGRPGVGIDPVIAAVSRPVNEVVTVEVAVATIFVHRGDVQIPGELVAGHLDVTHEAAVDLYWTVPGIPVIAGIGDKQSACADIKVVPRNVHPAIEWGRRIVIGPAGLAIVLTVAVDAKMSPAVRVPGSGGLVAAQALWATV